MSTTAKHTLFSFVTSRSPQLLDTYQKKTFFVEYPGDGQFDDLLQTINPEDYVSEYENAIANFTGKYEDMQQISTDAGAAFYEFENWLASNRTVIRELGMAYLPKGVEYLANPVTQISNEVMIKCWNNLFYQLLTNERPDIREQMIQILVASQFLTYAGQEVQSKVADARVIIPQGLYAPGKGVDNGTNNPGNPPTPHINPAPLERSISKLVSLEIIKTYESIITDIQKAKSVYEQANKIARAAAQKEYDANVKAIRSEWDADHAGDPPPAEGVWPVDQK